MSVKAGSIGKGRAAGPVRANPTEGDPRHKGFSLIEILVATVLISGLAASLLYSVALAVQVNRRSEDRWQSSLDLWNRAVESRRFPPADGEEFKPLKEARPLTRVLVCRDAKSGPDDCWEVLRAEK